ncbi:FAD-binding and (Fe-S)-binding domain-containing protein [Flavicella sediminum]|uniref:FAD-binding and (Fe-S)-binding domain-containing protein n=1 Tax=Flavicella sediminum TaxID=2585141 RepID=UPI00111D1038|nr:FAD-binding and (Fe-S)-binding domain-containing protein [Flavicella sediminum]
MDIKKALFDLGTVLEGELHQDDLHKNLYATDASVYRKIPKAVCYPKNESDLKKLVAFASKHKTSLIPRTAGTSLAGQCVGEGIVVDVSKYFTKIISFDEKAKTIKLQPGIIRDDLNRYLKPYGLFFGPNTSTSNRCMIGGMVGNNSSGTTSIRYGVTRDKVLSLKTILSNGEEATFETISSDTFLEKTKMNSLEGSIYKEIYRQLKVKENQEEIHREFPRKTIHRRNTGYAVDSLLKSDLFGGDTAHINLCELLCGSEGTLAFTTEITIKLDDIAPTHSVMLGVHFHSIQESLEAVVVAMKHQLYNCELMDKIILDCTKNNREQQKNRFFLQGDPKAILMLEVADSTEEGAERQADKLIKDLISNNFGYHHPKIFGKDIPKIHELRKAGLGLLGNIIGDDKAVACIEDTAVELKDLPAYISEFTQLMDRYQQEAVYYAHAGAGELHLRPILNLKKKADVVLFREITTATAKLVKKYQGSFSGEHGDGIVRSEFIPLMIGERNYQLLGKIKHAFDPLAIFNPGKIVNAYGMDQDLRFKADRTEPEITTLFDFSDSQGIVRVTEKCNGSGDCRKSVEAGGTMCPSYRATKNEKDTTRARANALREYLTNSPKLNKFDHKELKEVFDLCLSCKACASECPSNVDVASLKAEFLYQYYKEHKIPLRSKLFANNYSLNKIGSLLPAVTNSVLNTKWVKKSIGIAEKRSIPKLEKITLRKWYKKNKSTLEKDQNNLGIVYVFCDEFTNYYDVQVGIDTLIVLSKLGYTPTVVQHDESGRSAISKGMLVQAKKCIDANLEVFKNLVSEETPLVGMEPSAILGFRDEYPRLASDKKVAVKISEHTYTIEEFLHTAYKNGKINKSLFHSEKKTLKIHGHCHQKSLSSIAPTFEILNIPTNYTVSILATGCCGMAGSFGYEKEHYDLSMQVGEDSLFPKLRNLEDDVRIAASGTSCRHQIFDGVSKTALHPISILRAALI